MTKLEKETEPNNGLIDYHIPSKHYSSSGASYSLVYTPINNIYLLGIYVRDKQNNRIHVVSHSVVVLSALQSLMKGGEKWVRNGKYLSIGISTHNQATSALADAIRAMLRLEGATF